MDGDVQRCAPHRVLRKHRGRVWEVRVLRWHSSAPPSTRRGEGVPHEDGVLVSLHVVQEVHHAIGVRRVQREEPVEGRVARGGIRPRPVEEVVPVVVDITTAPGAGATLSILLLLLSQLLFALQGPGVGIVYRADPREFSVSDVHHTLSLSFSTVVVHVKGLFFSFTS